MINLMIIITIFSLIIIAGIIFFGIWIWSIIDCINSKMSPEKKIIWLLIIIIFNLLGTIIYFLIANKEKEENKDFQSKKRLEKSRKDKIIFGVCGGIGNYFSIDPVIIRLLFVITFFINGIGLLIYIIAAIIIPTEKNEEKDYIKNKNKIEKKQNTNNYKKDNKKKIIVLASLTIIGLFLILITAIISANILFKNNYNIKSVNVKYQDGIIITEKYEEKIIIDEIINSHNYKFYEGYNLKIIESKEADKEKCLSFQNDPYGMKIYNHDCKEYKHKFYIRNEDENIKKGFIVTSILIRNKIIEMHYEDFTEYDVKDISILNENEEYKKKQKEIALDYIKNTNHYKNYSQKEIIYLGEERLDCLNCFKFIFEFEIDKNMDILKNQEIKIKKLQYKIEIINEEIKKIDVTEII
jgi:phage shock protein C